MKIAFFSNTDWYLWNFRRSLVLALHESGEEVVLLSPHGPFGPLFQQKGVRWQEIAMDRRSLNPIRELLVLARLFRFIIKEKPDLLHCFTLKAVIYGGLCARIARVPMRIFSVDGLGYVFTGTDFKATALRPFVRVLIRAAIGRKKSRLILQNSDDVSALGKIVDSSIARKIPGAGVDCSRFSPCTFTEAERIFRVVLPARMIWEKGIREFVEASAILSSQGRRIEMVLAGSPDMGNPKSVPEAMLRRWVSEGLIVWSGHVTDMPKLLQSVDVVALPSYYREGLPTCLTEGGACGLPLITTNSPGCREAVTDEVNGLIVPPRDSAALAAAIGRLQDDPGLRARLGAGGRKRAMEEFDERIVIRKTRDVYRELSTC